MKRYCCIRLVAAKRFHVSALGKVHHIKSPLAPTLLDDFRVGVGLLVTAATNTSRIRMDGHDYLLPLHTKMETCTISDREPGDCRYESRLKEGMSRLRHCRPRSCASFYHSSRSVTRPFHRHQLHPDLCKPLIVEPDLLAETVILSIQASYFPVHLALPFQLFQSVVFAIPPVPRQALQILRPSPLIGPFQKGENPMCERLAVQWSPTRAAVKGWQPLQFVDNVDARSYNKRRYGYRNPFSGWRKL